MYVADEFYQKLRNWYALADKPTENWLISQAQYQVNWVNDTPDGDSISPVLHIKYQMEHGEGVEQVTIKIDAKPVSYKNKKLPTILLVKISVVAVS